MFFFVKNWEIKDDMNKIVTEHERNYFEVVQSV